MELSLDQNLNILVDAQKLISNKQKWTQGAYAKDSKGRPINEHSPYAVCFCAVGAVNKISPFISSQLEYLDLFTEDIGIVKYNDYHTHEEILVVFDKAIEQIKKELNVKQV